MRTVNRAPPNVGERSTLRSAVTAHAALQKMLDIFRGNAGTVILDTKVDPAACTGTRGHRSRGQDDAPARPLERVFEQIAEQFHQVALIAMEARGRINLEFTQDRFRNVDLLQAAHDFLGIRLQRERRGKRLMARRCRARQLVGDNFIHAPDLFQHRPTQRSVFVTILQLAAHYRQRGLQAVCKVG